MARTRSQKAEAREKFRMAANGLPGLAAVPKRQRGARSNRFRETTADPAQDARETVLTARCRMMGVQPTEAARLSMSVPMMGDPAGQAIHLGARGLDASRREEEARRLWQTFCAIDRAQDAYYRRILDKTRFAKTAKLELLPERFESRPEDSSDARTAEEKDGDARRHWRRWSQMMASLRFEERLALEDGLRLRCKLSEGGQLTTGGLAFVAAVRLMHRISDRA